MTRDPMGSVAFVQLRCCIFIFLQQAVAYTAANVFNTSGIPAVLCHMMININTLVCMGVLHAF